MKISGNEQPVAEATHIISLHFREFLTGWTRLTGLRNDRFDQDKSWGTSRKTVSELQIASRSLFPVNPADPVSLRNEARLPAIHKNSSGESLTFEAFEPLAIEADVYSEWMMFRGDDLSAHVRRKSDGKEFYVGLAEIEAVDTKSKNYQLLDDYSVWFVNNR